MGCSYAKDAGTTSGSTGSKNPTNSTSSPPKSAEPSDLDILKQDYLCIWFDPHPENNEKIASYTKGYFKYFDQLATSEACNKKLEDARKIKQAVFIISCGSEYHKIKNEAENNDMVDMIVIFCGNKDKHLHYKNESSKVIDVIDTQSDLCKAFEAALKQGTCAYNRFLRKFVGQMESRSFYLLSSDGNNDDENLILQCIAVTKDEYEGPNIFYPLSFETYKLKEEEWKRSLNEIRVLNKKYEFYRPKEIEKQREAVNTTLNEIEYLYNKAGKELQKEVVKSYTKEGLCYLMNYCMRTADRELLKTFAEYGFLLRASMSILGKPATELGCKKVYRGLILKKQVVELWRQKKGSYVLTPQYTSTTMEKSITEKFMRKELESDQRRVLMDITLTDDQGEFVKNLGKLRDLHNGIYYPVDISEYSSYKEEKEILFPPFYPMRIKDVKEDDTENLTTLVIDSPSFLSFGKMRERLVNAKKAARPASVEIRDAITKRSMELIEKNLMEVIDLQGCFGSDSKSIKRMNEFMKLCARKKISALNIAIFNSIVNTSSELFEEFLMKNLDTLLDLRLQYCKIDDKFVSIIAKALKNKAKLQTLMLTWHNMTNAGAMVLADGIKKNSTLVSLSLGKGRSDLNEDGWKLLCEAFVAHETLEALDLEDGELKDESFNLLAKGINNKKSFFKKIVLTIKEISADSLSAIGNALANCSELAEISLKNGSGRQIQGLPIVRALGNKEKLVAVCLSNINVGDAEILASGLAKSKNLKKLDLNAAKLKGKEIKIIVEAIRSHKDPTKGNSKQELVLLNLSENTIDEEAAKALGNLLAESEQLEVIKIYKTIGDSRKALHIAKGIKMENTVLKKMNLSFNQIDHESWKEIAKAMSTNKSIKHLALSENVLEDSAAEAIGEMLAKNSTLTKLKLDKSKLGRNGAAHLAKGLAKNKGIPEINMQGLKIESDGAKEVGKMLKENRTLKKIRLSSNKIGTEGAVAICDGLKNNPVLILLDLEKTLLNDTGAEAIGEMLKENTALEELILQYNSILAKGGAKIAKALETNAHLKKLCIGDNKIQDEGASAFGDMLTKNSTLEELELDNNEIKEEGGVSLAKGISKNSKLLRLTMSHNNIGDNEKKEIGKALEINSSLVCPELNNTKIADAEAKH